MKITSDELKLLTRLNTAISIRAWKMGYDLTRALGSPPAPVSFINEHRVEISSGELKRMQSANSIQTSLDL